MGNEHLKINRFTELDAEEIAAVNEINEVAVTVGELVEKLRSTTELDPDQRWIAIGAEDLQTGFMGLVRAITKPTFF